MHADMMTAVLLHLYPHTLSSFKIFAVVVLIIILLHAMIIVLSVCALDFNL